SEGLLRPDNLAGGNTPAEAAGVAQSLRFGEIHLALSQAIFGPLALGDVFAGDEHDLLIACPPHRFGIFADPEHGAVLANLSDFPGGRLAEVFQTEAKVLPDERSVFIKEDVQHGLSDQFADRIAELRSAKRIHGEDSTGRVDYEVHDRVVL